MKLEDSYVILARYNRWMNEKLYAMAAQLSDQERKRDVRAFFKSIHGTLDHILYGDRIWLTRFGVADVGEGGSGFVGAPVDAPLYEDFTELREERSRTDAQIDAFAKSLTEETLSAPLLYTRRGVSFDPPLAHAVSHFFNHQTHHRGQVTTLFMQLGRDPGVTDLIALLREADWATT